MGAAGQEQPHGHRPNSAAAYPEPSTRHRLSTVPLRSTTGHQRPPGHSPPAVCCVVGAETLKQRLCTRSQHPVRCPWLPAHPTADPRPFTPRANTRTYVTPASSSFTTGHAVDCAQEHAGAIARRARDRIHPASSATPVSLSSTCCAVARMYRLVIYYPMQLPDLRLPPSCRGLELGNLCPRDLVFTE